MKNVLAVLGVLAVVAIIAIAIGGFVMYKKGSSAVLTVSQQEVDRFITTKHPSEQVADSLHRIINGVKLHPSMMSTALVSISMTTVQDNIITDDEAKMLSEAAQLAEQGEITREKFGEFATKHANAMPKRNPH